MTRITCSLTCLSYLLPSDGRFCTHPEQFFQRELLSVLHFIDKHQALLCRPAMGLDAQRTAAARAELDPADVRSAGVRDGHGDFFEIYMATKGHDRAAVAARKRFLSALLFRQTVIRLTRCAPCMPISGRSSIFFSQAVFQD